MPPTPTCGLTWFTRMIAKSVLPARARESSPGKMVPPLEHRILHRDGSTRWIRGTVVQHRDQRGQSVRYDGLVEDITERKRAEQWFRTILELAPTRWSLPISQGKDRLGQRAD